MSDRGADASGHAGSVCAQLRQAARDGDLPDAIAARHDLDEDEEGQADE